jgi:hypothetical protein
MSGSLILRMLKGQSLATVACAVVLAPCDEGASSAPHAAAHDGSGRSAPTKGMVVRCADKGRPISPLIYGIGERPMNDTPDQWQLHPTGRRWGGNHTSRYNWELGNAWNTGKDWFFENVSDEAGPGPAYARFITEGASHGAVTALTVPTIGWVAKDTHSYGFPISVFGAQRAVAPENADIGNGLDRGGGLVPPGSPDRTSTPMTPAGVGRWVHAVRALEQSQGRRSVPIYILDNEPTLWNETHRDVHPTPVSYDELLDRTVSYAAQIRTADPDARIAGPAAWGYLALFESGVDVAGHPGHPDRDRHGGVALMPWWLGEVAAAERRASVRLLDLVDVHFYPQGKGIGVGTEGAVDADTAARRIRSTRALWDPQYVDESWIQEAVQLVPRLDRWIAERHPGLGVMIGEYNFGAENHMSGGLAVAEALGRFAQTGVAAAFYWDHPPSGSPAYWAFRAYRDFDGAGARFEDEWVPSDSGVPLASVFASRDDAKGHVVLVVLDLDPRQAVQTTLDVSSCGALADARRYVFTGDRGGFARTDMAAAPESAIPLALPPYSITVLDLHFRPRG